METLTHSNKRVSIKLWFVSAVLFWKMNRRAQVEQNPASVTGRFQSGGKRERHGFRFGLYTRTSVLPRYNVFAGGGETPLRLHS